MIVLGIESSCDETAAALVRDDGLVLADVVASQIALHAPYGGVVPELASRAHMQHVIPVIERALAQAGRDLSALDGVAVTNGPGLIGALLIGVQTAKAIAFARGLPLVGVNHLVGHLLSPFLHRAGDAAEAPEYPFIALLASGGHTALYEVRSSDDVEQLGQTRDDAAGEAFDKVAKLLELGYPGGPRVDFLAPHGNANAVQFAFAQIKHRDRNPENRHAPDVQRIDFSYSGIKTAVLRYVELHGMRETIAKRRGALGQIASPTREDYLALCDKQTLDLAASFQRAVVNDLVSKTLYAAREFNA